MNPKLRDEISAAVYWRKLSLRASNFASCVNGPLCCFQLCAQFYYIIQLKKYQIVYSRRYFMYNIAQSIQTKTL